MAVVVVNYGSSRLLARHLAPLDLTALDARVVVVDNHSDAAELAAVRALAAEHGWDLVAMADNSGFGGGMNAGMDRAGRLGCTSFLLLNPDAVVTPGVVRALHDHVDRSPSDLVAPRVVDSAGGAASVGSVLDGRTGRIRGLRAPVPGPDGAVHLEGLDPAGRLRGWMGGACLALHADLRARVGGFDEPFFLYWEDVDLSVRVERAGGRLVVRTDLQVVHDAGGTQGEQHGRAKSGTYYYFNCRNRLLFATRHLDRRGLARWIAATPAVSREILLRGGRRQLLHSSEPLLATVRGSLSGVGLAVRALVTRDGAASRAPAGPWAGVR